MLYTLEDNKSLMPVNFTFLFYYQCPCPFENWNVESSVANGKKWEMLLENNLMSIYFSPGAEQSFPPVAGPGPSASGEQRGWLSLLHSLKVSLVGGTRDPRLGVSRSDISGHV